MRDRLLDWADYLHRLSERVASHPRFWDLPVLQRLDEGLEWAFRRLSDLAQMFPAPSPVASQLDVVLLLVGDLNQAVDQVTPNTLSECLLKNAANYHLAQAATVIQQLQQQRTGSTPG